VWPVTTHVPEGDPTEEAVEQLPEVLTPDQAAWLLQLSRGRLDAAAERGEVPSRKIGRQRRYSKRALLRLVDGCDE
jgi:excisionase family DNA binding protein